MGNLRPALDKIAADKTEVMLTLRGDAQRLGPGVVERWQGAKSKFQVAHKRTGAIYAIKDTADEAHTIAKEDCGPEYHVVEALPEGHAIYKITSKSLVQTAAGKPPVEVTVPVLFDATDVSVIIEVPKNIDNEPLIQTPGAGGKRSPGGLHIG